VQVPPAASPPERQDYERRFLAEARIAARLTHAGIVVVHDVARDAENDILYIALEYLQGRTLADLAAAGGLDWREALRLVGRVADALHYAHRQGVIHRDIKPANIMVLPTGEPKIMDFGIAKLDAAALTAAGGLFGTPLFMSPEQASGQSVDARTDIFSLGSVAYLLLAGRPPFEADSVPAILARVTYQHPRPLREAAPGLSADVEYVVARAMAKEPALRYADGRTMAEDIEDVLAGREPRHRKAWTPPVLGAGTLASADSALPELTLEPEDAAVAARPRRRRRVLRLFGMLAAVVAVWFLLHPADWGYWRETLAEARQSALVEQVRAGRLWAILLDAPTPAPPVPMTGSLPRPPLAAPNAPPSVPVSAAAPAPSPEVAAGPEAAPLPTALPATLAVQLAHDLRRGTLQVWVDGRPVLEDEFDGREARKLLFFKERKGVVQHQLPLSAGRHDVRVQVRWDDNTKARTIAGAFKPGETRRLDVEVGGRRGTLSLDWR
jgi:serine/threonine-protein kinase